MIARYYRQYAEYFWVAAILAVMGLLAFLAVYEAQTRPTSGEVIDKQHIEAFNHVHTTQTCAVYNSNGTCTQYTTNTHVHYHPDEYYIIIEGYNDSGDFKKGKWRLNESEYADVEVGESWSYDGSRTHR